VRVPELRIFYIALAIVVLIVGYFIYSEFTVSPEEKYIREMSRVSTDIGNLLNDYKREADKVSQEIGKSLDSKDLTAVDCAKIDEKLQSYAANIGNNINDLADLAKKWKYQNHVPEKYKVRHDNWIKSIELVADWLLSYSRLGTYRDASSNTYKTAPAPGFLLGIYSQEIQSYITYLNALS